MDEKAPASEAERLPILPRSFEGMMKTYVRGPREKEVVIGDGLPTVLLGERIDPFAKGPVKDGMVTGNMEPIRKGALGQVEAGRMLPYAMAADLDGVCAIKVGDRITTDHIMPAGARLKYRSNIPKYARYVFEHVDPSLWTPALRTGEVHREYHRGGRCPTGMARAGNMPRCAPCSWASERSSPNLSSASMRRT